MKVFRKLSALGIAAMILAFPLSVFPGDYQVDLTYESSGNSVWGPGPSSYSASNFIGKSWNANPSIGGVAHTWLGDYGAEAWVKTDGKIGIQNTISVDGGSVAVSLPVDFTLNYPDIVSNGQSFHLNSGYTVLPSASISSTPFNASLSSDLIFDVYAAAGGELCVVGCVGGSWTVMDVNVSKRFFSATLSPDELEVDIAGIHLSTPSELSQDFGFVNATLSIPNLGGSNLGTKLQTQDEFIEVMVDIDAIATTALGLPPLEGGIGSVSYNILDMEAGPVFGLAQTLKFNEDLVVDFEVRDLDNNYLYMLTDISASAIKDATFVMPGGGNGIMVTPTFHLGGSLYNSTSLTIDPRLSIEALTFELFGKTLGPVIDWEATGDGFDIDIYGKNYCLPKVAIFTGASFTVSAPEPSIIASLLCGFAFLGTGFFARQRRKNVR
jgi:hypothetical protein